MYVLCNHFNYLLNLIYCLLAYRVFVHLIFWRASLSKKFYIIFGVVSLPNYCGITDLFLPIHFYATWCFCYIFNYLLNSDSNSILNPFKFITYWIPIRNLWSLRKCKLTASIKQKERKSLEKKILRKLHYFETNRL